MGEIFAGRYELVDLLGTGGVGDVWRVWDHRDGGYRAGKVLRQSDSTSLLRFVREARWHFDHPHLLAPTGWAGEDDRIIFAMPLVHGGSMSGLLRDYGPLPQAWVLPAIGQLLEALHVIHSAGLVHRDVKPANILLRPGRVPDIVLSDFGTAAPIAEPRLTRVTQVIGTPGYMSPEAKYGADPEPAQDLYSVGVVLIELLTGARPDDGNGTAVVPRCFEGTALGGFIAHLVAEGPARTVSAAQAWRELSTIVPAPSPGEPVEVFDQIGPLPAGWGPEGPSGWVAPVRAAPDWQGPAHGEPGTTQSPARESPATAPASPSSWPEPAWPAPSWHESPASPAHEGPVPAQWPPAAPTPYAPQPQYGPGPGPGGPNQAGVVAAPTPGPVEVTPATTPVRGPQSGHSRGHRLLGFAAVAAGLLCIVAAVLLIR